MRAFNQCLLLLQLLFLIAISVKDDAGYALKLEEWVMIAQVVGDEQSANFGYVFYFNLFWDIELIQIFTAIVKKIVGQEMFDLTKFCNDQMNFQ